MRRRKKLRAHVHTTFHAWYLTLLPAAVLLVGLLFVFSLLKATADLKSIGKYLRSPDVAGARGGVIYYKIEEGDTLQSLASEFGISVETIVWENDLQTTELTPDVIIRIPPVTGVVHTVRYKDTVESIAAKYGVDPQKIINYRYNEFSNDPAFPLSVGQFIIVPDGRK